MAFWMYDLIFLSIFGLIGGIFILKRRKSLKRELGIFILYRTKVGLKLIDYISEKHKRLLNYLTYIIIIIGYALMVYVSYIFVKLVYDYASKPIFTEVVKAPPLMLVIPYFPRIFGAESFFPEFYFTYFLVAFAIVATIHEFSHGIFAKFNKVRIKSTGLVFLGPLPAGAFVEQNDKDMEKASKKGQLAILGAGVFSNAILAIIFFLLWWLLFSVSFVPAGYMFSAYSASAVNISNIENIGGLEVQNLDSQGFLDAIQEDLEIEKTIVGLDGREINLTKISTIEEDYFIVLESARQLKGGAEFIQAYDNLPALNAGLRGNIIEVNSQEIKTFNDLSKTMQDFSPGQKVNIKTNYNGEILSFDVVLAEDSNQEGRAILGVGNSIDSLLKIDENFAVFKVPFTKYNIKGGDFVEFIYYLIFWVFLLNLLVAFVNMLPLLIFDGGRFFYLTIWGITGNKKVAEKLFKWIGIAILASLALLMVVWFLRVVL